MCDEESSVADELLIGDWVARSDPNDPPSQVSIHRKQDASNVLECVELGVIPDQEDDDDVLVLCTTKVRSLRLISWCEQQAGEPPSYSIWLIEPEDEDHLRIYMLDEEVIGKAILAGKLSGHVRRGWFFGWYARALRITSEPDELRQYLAHAGRACFDHSSPLWTLTRLEQSQ